MTTNEILAFENRSFEINDNAKAEAIVSALGLLGPISATDPGTPDMTRIFPLTQHATHWLLVLKFSGQPDPSHNGFVIYGWPRSAFPSRAVLDGAIKLATEDCLPGSVSRHRTMVATSIGAS